MSELPKIELEAALAKSPWIPVTERVPDHSFDVFVLINGENGSIGCHKSRWLCEEYNPDRITHWMEIPDTPK